MGKTVGQEIEAVGVDLSWLFQEGIHEAIVFCKTCLEQIAKAGPEAVSTAIKSAVAAAEAAGGTGATKLEAATVAVISSLSAEGISLVESVIQAGINAVVTDWNANGGWPQKL